MDASRYAPGLVGGETELAGADVGRTVCGSAYLCHCRKRLLLGSCERVRRFAEHRSDFIGGVGGNALRR